jgi:SAM-dependent methyltransferase
MSKLYDYNWLVKYFSERKMGGLSPSFSGTLLDVGSSGRTYEYIFGPYVSRYIALDILWDRNIDLQADGMRLPFRDGCVDAVLCVDALYFFTEPEKAFAEFHRVLKPRGRLVVFASQSWRTMDERCDYFRFTNNGLSYLARHAGLAVLEASPLDGYWAKMGAQINYFFLRIHRRFSVLSPLFHAIYLVNNVLFYFLNKIDNVKTETINNCLIAVKGDKVVRESVRQR